jgi:translation initiation factor 2-alpha kinase 4
MLGRAAASGPVAAGGRQLLTPVAEHSREGRASTPSTKGGPTSLLAAASDGSSGSSEGGSEESGGSEEGSGSGSGSGDGSICEEASASFGGAGSSLSANLAVAGANRLLSAHGSDSQLNTRPSSSVDGAFLSAWDSQTESQSGTLSTSAGLSVPGGTSSSGGGAGAAHASLTVSGSGEFTFDRSRPLGAISGGGGVGGGGGGGISTQPSTTATQRSRRSQRGAGHPVQQQVLFIQMEFCPRTVRDVLDSRELDEERRWSILRQILAGLAHIHAQGIIHRDLKAGGGVGWGGVGWGGVGQAWGLQDCLACRAARAACVCPPLPSAAALLPCLSAYLCRTRGPPAAARQHFPGQPGQREAGGLWWVPADAQLGCAHVLVV